MAKTTSWHLFSFQRRLQAALHGIDGVAVVADNVLVYGTDEREEEACRKHDEACRKHDEDLVQVLPERRSTVQYQVQQAEAASTHA